MAWHKKGRIYCPDGTSDWARHSFMTPCPWQRDDTTIRLFGGIRDDHGVSRIGWVDVDAADPSRIKGVSQRPVLEIGAPGMFDDNGVILGDVLQVGPEELRLYYVGFQLVAKAKFLAFTGVAVSRDRGDTFVRLQDTPIIDRSPEAPHISALHSIARLDDGSYRIWFARGQGWEEIDGRVYPRYDSWTMTSPDGLHFDNSTATRIVAPAGDEYRIGRPRATRRPDGTWHLRVTSDTRSKQYACFLFTSPDGVTFARTDTVELPRGDADAWDGEMTCYPAHHQTPDGRQFLFYNGNGMGQTGVGYAEWVDA